MMHAALRIVAPFALAALAACASEMADLGPLKTRQTAYGPVLTDANGMTLYTVTSDAPGASNCVSRCATAWPPLFAGSDARPSGRLSLVTRPDGARQYAWDGWPLYLWSKDLSPGDVAGHNYGDVWKVAKP